MTATEQLRTKLALTNGWARHQHKWSCSGCGLSCSIHEEKLGMVDHSSDCPIRLFLEAPAEPEPVHDFAWAMRQMLDGKKVYRLEWQNRACAIYMDDERMKCTVFSGRQRNHEETLFHDDYLAKDWEVFSPTNPVVTPPAPDICEEIADDIWTHVFFDDKKKVL